MFWKWNVCLSVSQSRRFALLAGRVLNHAHFPLSLMRLLLISLPSIMFDKLWDWNQYELINYAPKRVLYSARISLCKRDGAILSYSFSLSWPTCIFSFFCPDQLTKFDLLNMCTIRFLLKSCVWEFHNNDWLHQLL